MIIFGKFKNLYVESPIVDHKLLECLMIVLFLFINCATAPRDVVMLLVAYEFLWGLVPCLMLMMNCLKTKGM